MDDLTLLPHQLDDKKGVCRAIIETPKGCRSRFNYDRDSGLFMLSGPLPEGMMFPCDFGFIPSTLGEDGDPLDIMVLMAAPAHVGCFIEVRLIGVITAEQTKDGKTNDRLLGIAVHSYDYGHEDLHTISEVREALLGQVEAFFVSYNQQRGKEFTITGTGGPKKAIKVLKSGIQAHKQATKKQPPIVAGCQQLSKTVRILTFYRRARFSYSAMVRRWKRTMSKRVYRGYRQ